MKNTTKTPGNRPDRYLTAAQLREHKSVRTSVYWHSPNTIELKAMCVERGVSFNGVVDELMHICSPVLLEYFQKPVAFRMKFNWPRK